jgi:hypothetical protein
LYSGRACGVGRELAKTTAVTLQIAAWKTKNVQLYDAKGNVGVFGIHIKGVI